MPMENPSRIGLRLKAARKRAGLTQQHFADSLGVRHRQTVAAIERGERRLRARELVRAIGILDVGLDYFTDPFRLVGEGQFTFRTSRKVEQRVLDKFEERAGSWLAAYRELSREQGRTPRWLGYKLNLAPNSSLEDAKAAGETAAHLWRLGSRPSERLRSVMEDRLGILVLYVEAPSGISGAAVRVGGLNCALVSRRESEGRRNLDLAHGLFHLLTWDALPPERTIAVHQPARGRRSRAERLAEHFVASLLMPEAAAGIGDCSVAIARTALLRDSAPLPFSAEFMRRVDSALGSGRLSVRRTADILGLAVGDVARLLRAYGHETYFTFTKAPATCVAEDRTPTWMDGSEL